MSRQSLSFHPSEQATIEHFLGRLRRICINKQYNQTNEIVILFNQVLASKNIAEEKKEFAIATLLSDSPAAFNPLVLALQHENFSAVKGIFKALTELEQGELNNDRFKNFVRGSLLQRVFSTFFIPQNYGFTAIFLENMQGEQEFYQYFAEFLDKNELPQNLPDNITSHISKIIDSVSPQEEIQEEAVETVTLSSQAIEPEAEEPKKPREFKARLSAAQKRDLKRKLTSSVTTSTIKTSAPAETKFIYDEHYFPQAEVPDLSISRSKAKPAPAKPKAQERTIKLEAFVKTYANCRDDFAYLYCNGFIVPSNEAKEIEDLEKTRKELEKLSDFINSRPEALADLSSSFIFSKPNFANLGRLLEFFTYYKEGETLAAQGVHAITLFSVEKNQIVNELFYFIIKNEEIPLWLQEKIEKYGGIKGIEEYVFNPGYKKILSDESKVRMARLPQDYVLQDLINNGAVLRDINNFIAKAQPAQIRVTSLKGLVTHPQHGDIIASLRKRKSLISPALINEAFDHALEIGASDFLRENEELMTQWLKTDKVKKIWAGFSKATPKTADEERIFFNFLRIAAAADLDLNISEYNESAVKIILGYIASAITFACTLDMQDFKKGVSKSLDLIKRIPDTKTINYILTEAIKIQGNSNPFLVVPLIEAIRNAGLLSNNVIDNIFAVYSDESSPKHGFTMWHDIIKHNIFVGEEEKFLEAIRFLRSLDDSILTFVLEPRPNEQETIMRKAAEKMPAAFKKFFHEFVEPLQKDFRAKLYKPAENPEIEIDQEGKPKERIYANTNFLCDAIKAAGDDVEFVKIVLNNAQATLDPVAFYTLFFLTRVGEEKNPYELVLEKFPTEQKYFTNFFENARKKLAQAYTYQVNLQKFSARFLPLLSQKVQEGKHINFDVMEISEDQKAFNRDYLLRQTNVISRLVHHLNASSDFPYPAKEIELFKYNEIKEVIWFFLFHDEDSGRDTFPLDSFERAKRTGMRKEHELAVELTFFALKGWQVPLWLQKQVSEISDEKTLEKGLTKIKDSIENPAIKAILDNSRKDEKAPSLTYAKTSRKSSLQVMLEGGANLEEVKKFYETKGKVIENLRPTPAMLLNPELGKILEFLQEQHGSEPAFQILKATFYAEAIQKVNEDFLKENQTEVRKLMKQYITPPTVTSAADLLLKQQIARGFVEINFSTEKALLPFYDQVSKIKEFRFSQPDGLLEHMKDAIRIYPNEFIEYLKEVKEKIPAINFNILLMFDLPKGDQPRIGLIDLVKTNSSQDLEKLENIYKEVFSNEQFNRFKEKFEKAKIEVGYKSPPSKIGRFTVSKTWSKAPEHQIS